MLYCVVIVTNTYLFGAYWPGMNAALRTCVGPFVNTAILGWGVMPAAGKWFRRWLSPAQPTDNRLVKCCNDGCM